MVKRISPISDDGKTGHVKNKIRTSSNTIYKKINSKWIKDINIRLDIMKLLEDNIARTLFDINCSDIFAHLLE